MLLNFAQIRTCFNFGSAPLCSTCVNFLRKLTQVLYLYSISESLQQNFDPYNFDSLCSTFFNFFQLLSACVLFFSCEPRALKLSRGCFRVSVHQNVNRSTATISTCEIISYWGLYTTLRVRSSKKF